MKFFFGVFAGLFVSLAPSAASAQSPVSSFTGSATCLQQNVVVTNSSSNADHYDWDFCADDFSNLKFSGNLAVVNGLTYGTSIKLVEDNGQWTGFALAWYTDRLIRFDFGNSPLNSPTITNLGNPSNVLSFPQSIDLIQQNGSWFGFIANIDVGAGITMLDFGSSLTNTPTISNLGFFGTNDRIFDVRAVKQGTDYFLVFAKVSTTEIVTVNFRDSFYNSTTGFVTATTLSGPSYVTSIDVAWSGSSWKAFITSFSTNEIYQFDFGTDLANTPTKDASYPAVVTNPYQVRVVKQADEFFLVVSENTAGNARIFNYHDLNPSNTPTVLSYTSITGLVGMFPFRYSGMTVVLGIGTTPNISELLFQSNCGANTTYISANTPTGIQYSAAGVKKIELAATKSSTNETDRSGTSLTISSLTAPDIDFSSQNSCANNAVNFTSINQSGGLSSLLWNFGDGNNSTGTTTSHIYTAASTNSVTLTATATNSCQNIALKNLTINNQPVANFSLPLASPVCTNQNYLFTNTSTFDAGSTPSWQWSVNGVNVSTSQNLNYTINSTTAQTIKLVASIPGCSTQSSQNLPTVLAGPSISFTSAATGCVNTGLLFTNTTTDPTTGFSWNFGDGNLAGASPVTHAFASTGIYNVTLSASNAAGCQNSAVKAIPVYSVPQPDFAIEAPPFSCANFPSQFDNNTPPLSDSNVSSWSWNFGDPSTTTDVSSAKNPNYTYATASAYTVTLVATSNFGCSANVQKSVNILQPPVASFSNNVACVNQVTDFADGSQGAASWQWTIAGINYGTENLSYVFKSTGTFPVTLTATAANNCKNQVTKNIIVPVAPALDFSTAAPCANHVTMFKELNPGGADPTASWSWDFSPGRGTGSPVQTVFSASGGYAVTMTTTRASGCVYSVTKNVNIFDGPVASFTPSVYAGGAPLSVTFTNNSSGADSINWQFGDPAHTSSAVLSPQFVYTQLGNYKPLLTAVDRSLGCKDTLSTEIRVVVPSVDLEVVSLTLLTDPLTNSTKPSVTILNTGNIPSSNPVVLIDLGGGALLTENIMVLLPPGASIQRTLDVPIVIQSVSYVCAQVEEPGDTNSNNDRQCVTVGSDDVVLEPYPNPATTQINFDWISVSDETVNVTILKSNGQVVQSQDFAGVTAGINHLNISTSSLAGGLYLIQFSGSRVKRAFRFMVAN